MDSNEIELQALITERCGMVALNDYRLGLGQGIAYSEDSFYELANRMRDLKPIILEG